MSVRAAKRSEAPGGEPRAAQRKSNNRTTHKDSNTNGRPSQDVFHAVQQFETLLSDLNRVELTPNDPAANSIAESQARLTKGLLIALPNEQRQDAARRCKIAALTWDGIGDMACALIDLPRPTRRGFLLDESADDEGNARSVKALFGQELAHSGGLGWLYFDGRRWDHESANPKLTQAILETLKMRRRAAVEAEREAIVKTTRGTARNVRETAFILKDLVDVRAGNFDRDPWALNCQNGTIDLRTAQLKPHDPDDRLTKIVPVDFDLDATCPQWISFLRDVLPSPELRAFVARAVGYTLTGSVREQCLFFAYGTGRNGKTTFFEPIKELMGEYGLKIATETLMLGRRDPGGASPDVARLRGARMAIAAEVEEGRRLAESLVKDLVGGDTITARFLHKNPIEFRPTHKLWAYGNHKPRILGTDEAIWRRIQLIPFTVTIPKSDVDPDLADKLMGELPGILAWSLRGCLDWQENGLQVPSAVNQATSDYRSEMDELEQFVTDCCVVESLAKVGRGELHEAYVKWGGDLRKRAFGSRIRERGFHPDRGTDNKAIWSGIGLLARGAELP